ncbi:MAG: endoribonuclease MazF [bacterium]|nr:endoribonuclease MazF [bacterium]MDE0288122.1 endoribonuclease MazF [bacterium]MDE0438434.1 endoribonuclease MazF [bacterium]
MVERHYVPDRGDIVWLSFTPRVGHEQPGHRPALVVSPRVYNDKTSLALCCQITSKVKGYPFEVALPGRGSITGVILSDRLKSLDWRARRAQFAAQAPEKVVREVLDKVAVLLQS